MDWRLNAKMAELLSETQMTVAASSSMFPGFKFSPTDEELILYYLKKKIEGSHKCVQVISEIDICKYEPWELPAKSFIQSENEWFFFSPRGRKYPNGLQSKRATESGYWKATGKERNVKSGSHLIGTKRTLVFHAGRAPKGERTEWIMHEYSISGEAHDPLVVCRLRKNCGIHLNDAPRQDSISQRHISDQTNNSCSLSEVGIEQSSLCQEGKATEFYSKASSSSNNSHSVEQQIDSGSDSKKKLIDKFPQPSSSPKLQVCNDEECYAGILKDDIVDLGKSLMPSTPDPLPTIATTLEDERFQQPAQAIPSHVLPFQGTANRRIRLRKKLGNYRAEPPEAESSSES